MTRQILAVLLASTLFAGKAYALEAPKQGEHDPRMRVIAYSPDQVVDLHAGVGATVAIQFADTETVTDVAASDRANTKIAPNGSVLFLKPERAMAAQPMFVKTHRADGSVRLYTFQWQATDAAPPVPVPSATPGPVATVSASTHTTAAPGPGATPLKVTQESSPSAAQPASDCYYAVRFTYPDDDAQARAATAKQASADRSAARARAALAAAPAQQNWRYVAQGNGNLVPDQVWDDGMTTFLHFPGNVRMPAIYVVGPDGKEALANYSVEGGTISIHQTARAFRLRDGDTVLNIWNQGWDPLGTNPETGTVSRNVLRTVRHASR